MKTNFRLSSIIISLLWLCTANVICNAVANELMDAHSLQESYAKVAEKAFPAVVVIMNCQYNGTLYPEVFLHRILVRQRLCIDCKHAYTYSYIRSPFL